MIDNIYYKAIIALIASILSIIVIGLIVKKFKIYQFYTTNKTTTNTIQILSKQRLDHNKFVVSIKCDGIKYNCIIADNYGLVLGGESRIRTYERARRADLQSAAFGHSATSPDMKE